MARLDISRHHSCIRSIRRTLLHPCLHPHCPLRVSFLPNDKRRHFQFPRTVHKPSPLQHGVARPGKAECHRMIDKFWGYNAQGVWAIVVVITMCAVVRGLGGRGARRERGGVLMDRRIRVRESKGPGWSCTTCKESFHGEG